MPNVQSGPCEPLEPRQLLSASVARDTLNVRGPGNAGAATIVVDNSADGQSVDVSIDWTTRRGATKSFDASFPKTMGFNAIRVFGGKGNDAISIGQGANGPIALDARVNGRAGNDAITTSAGNDTVLGHLGDDTIVTGDGNDIAHGGKGLDTLTGGAGDDRLWGNRDDDTLNGGDGNDVLGGIVGVNVMTGGAGQDHFHVTVGIESNPTNDFNATEDVLMIRTPKDEDPTPKV